MKKGNLSRFKSVQVEFEEERPFFVREDRNLLKLILRNLVSNAIKFTPKKGKVSIFTQKKKKKVRLEVLDTGHGMNAEKLNNLKKFNHRNSTPGTEGEIGMGLGLMLSNEFAKLNRGRLFSESNPGNGTKVILELPLEESTVSNSA